MGPGTSGTGPFEPSAVFIDTRPPVPRTHGVSPSTSRTRVTSRVGTRPLHDDPCMPGSRWSGVCLDGGGGGAQARKGKGGPREKEVVTKTNRWCEAYSSTRSVPPPQTPVGVLGQQSKLCLRRGS